ncbi:hypothetical protein I633_21886 (plasmid) [Alteromonas mediterranea 615]|uniref:Uncharacterized protein n=1 Tax=Alteromonas mediterranea 615 TaxID=1300253 RepID=S5AKW0_9ALTE|nr:hypothetical protein I633_21886 [Alteromonas mediterranea 615]|tara:strand:+ start:5969 stop:6388 length:420 start_codon:yes stop_codon:yes gene_type:complete
MKQFFSNFFTSEQNEEDVKRAYAILSLSSHILSEADDIEDVYNAYKLFLYAFLTNNLSHILKENVFVKLSKEKFEYSYRSKNLIEQSVLNLKVTKELHEDLQTLLTRIRNSEKEKMNLDEHIDYVFENRVQFVSYARNL